MKRKIQTKAKILFKIEDTKLPQKIIKKIKFYMQKNRIFILIIDTFLP